MHLIKMQINPYKKNWTGYQGLLVMPSSGSGSKYADLCLEIDGLRL
jgi:hypothetical protein